MVQRRLFGSLGDDEVHKTVAAAYGKNYEAELLAVAETEAERREAGERARTLEQRIAALLPVPSPS